jgi:polysaccharide biosynthesis protein PslH
MTHLARRHDLTAVAMINDEFDAEECRRAMQAYCREVVLIPNPCGLDGLSKRLGQLGSLASTRSYEQIRVNALALQPVLDQLLRTRRFDVVNLESSFLGCYNFRRAPPGEKPPPLIIDSHNIDYDVARQYARVGSLVRRIYAGVNWRKLRREELATYRNADGVCLCSAADERRLLDDVPGVRTAVIPNAADVEFYQPRHTDPPPDGRTVVFFGALNYVPNVDGVLHFAKDIWPRIAEAHPHARCKFIGGGRLPPALLELAGPRIDLTGFVPDLRPHLASASAVVVPLRLGGGTRLKIVEAMAMGKAIVSTKLGAEGIDAVPGRDLLIEDEPAAFADAVMRLLAEPDLAARIGRSARRLAVERYAWSGAAEALEDFYRQILESKQYSSTPSNSRIPSSA